MTKHPKKTSASGEVSSITGYWKQYEYSACTLYRLMQEGTLEAITIADPSAGMFDDLVLHMNGQVHATQVKSQKDASYISLGTELKGPLVSAMADSWLSLEEKFGEGKVRLRYIFAGYFNTSDTSLANAGTSGARHSAEFARFISRQDLTPEIVQGSIWSGKLSELEKLSGLDAAKFMRFVNNLKLEDGTELQRNKIDIFPPAEREKIEAIRNLLPTLIVGATSGQMWSEQELIHKLGWRSRLSQRNIHVFPVPEDYQDNQATERRLLDRITRTSSGYLALVGPPGTGKSTLLQRGIYSTPAYSVSRYLAFHPGQRHGLGRAEAGEFLNDLIAELKALGFYGSRFAQDDLSSLRKEFISQLEYASERFRSTGRKTIIVIDGLDHVPREENPTASFLAELPAAKAVPEGVIFLLGTQRLELPQLHPTIIQQVKESDRTIVIDPLTRAAVFALANAAGLPDFVARDDIFDACHGHPLTARYFIEALRGASTADDAARILSHADGLGQSLQQIYERVWLKLGTATSSQGALGVLARAEGNLSPHQVAQASNDEAAEDVLSTAGFLLSRTADGRVSIFHNSFRLFIAGETGKKFGAPSPDIESEYQRRLAEIARTAPADDPQHWLELRYRSRAGDDATVLALGTPDYFRRSLQAFRPSGEIYSDLRLTYAAVRPTRDRALLLNKLLIAKEIEYRLEAVRDLDLVDLLLDLGDVELATRHALDAGESGDGWLGLVDHYWYAGEHERARQIFEANEPLEVLFGAEGFDPYENMQKAEGWIQRAQRFRPIEKLSTLIDSLIVQTRPSAPEDGGTATRRELKYYLALGAVTDERCSTLEALQDVLSLDDSDLARLTVESARLDHQAGKNESVLTRLQEAEAMPVLMKLHPSWRRAVAMLACKIGALDIAGRMAASLSIPRLDNHNVPEAEAGDSARAVIESAFLAEVTGTAIPEAPRVDRGEPSTLLSSAHVKMRELGTLRAKVNLGDPGNASQALKTIVLFFTRAQPEPSDFHAYRFFGALGEIARQIVSIAHDLGNDAFRDVVKFVDAKLHRADNNLSRSELFRLKFAALVFDIDKDVAAARRRIEGAQAVARQDRTPHEAVSSRAEIARAFGHIGLIEEARSVLQSIHQDTLGYWLRAKKEPQYTFWAWSFLKACEASPARREVSSLAFAQFILGMDETEGDETAMRLVGDLLEGACGVPSAAAGITSRLIDSNLATWAKIADAALASIAVNAPFLAAQVLISFSRLVVPFIHSGVDRCLRACLEVLEPTDRAQPIRLLASSIAIWCPPLERQALLEEILEFAPKAEDVVRVALQEAIEVAAKLRGLTHGDKSSSSSSSSGASLDIDVTTLEELIVHGDGRTKYGDGIDYSYARAAERVATSATKAQIESFVGLRPDIESDAKVMAAISKRMLVLGDREAALHYFAKAEAAASSGYWSTFFGGQKLEVQRMRIELDGALGREKGFDILVSELAGGQTSGSSLFLNLHVVLELVTNDVPFERFWIETEDHLKQYREFRLAPSVHSISAVQTHADFLAFVVAEAFDFSCPEVLQHARAAAILIARESTQGQFVEKLFELLHQQADGPREIAALMYRLRDAPYLRETLLRQATSDATNADFIIANLAKRVLTDLGATYQAPPATSLPPFYDLVTEKSDQDDNFDPPPGLITGHRPVWSDDPWTWTSMLRLPFRILADGCSIPMGQLRRRCAIFMAKEGGRAAFGPEAEEAILAKLRRMHLHFAYRRPLAMASLRAFGKLLQELDVADEVDQRMLPTIWPEIGGPTLSDWQLDFEARPSWIPIPPLPSREFGGIGQEEWLESAADVVSSTLLPGAFVLAEQTYFRVQAWRSSAESIKITLPSTADVDEGFDGLPGLLSLDRLRPLYNREDSKLLCLVPSDLFGDLRTEAITICPYVAQALEWSRSSTMPLTFIDAKGEIVAQTIRWTDGTSRESRHDTELFGCGQTLVLTRNGLAQLQDQCGAISLGVRVDRKVMDESQQTRSRRFVAVAR